VESPSMAEVGPPVILSLGVAGYCSVIRLHPRWTAGIARILLVACAGWVPSSTLLAQAEERKPPSPLTALESLQFEGITSGMAATEQRLPKGGCVRFTACVAPGDPSPSLMARLHDLGYRAVRSCTKPADTIPARCVRAQVNVLEPLADASVVREIVFDVSGAVSIRCSRPVVGGPGQHFSSSRLDCVARNERPGPSPPAG
jgi:hypothetical protein